MELTINQKFRSLLPALSNAEYAALEASIAAEGCRDAIITWQGQIVDGHNRYEICQKVGIPFSVSSMYFTDEDAVMDWIDANQIARRNLSPADFRLALGRRYNRTKKAHGGAREASDQNDHLRTAETIATESNVSPSTVKRAGQYADAVAAVAGVAPDFDHRTATNQTVLAAAKIIDATPNTAVEIIARGEKEILQKAREIQSCKREAKRADVIHRLESIETLEAKTIDGVYDVIVIDPPWPMEKIERDVRQFRVGLDYPTMDETELSALRVPCAGSCHIWIWTTHKFLPMAFRLLNSWGMKYVCTFVWHKPGGFQPFGLPQYNCEMCLYARVGTPEFVDTTAFPTCFSAERGIHSEKPGGFYDTVKRVTRGRRLNMFSRKAIDGFDGWGKEAQ